jgi:hypothetical protein
MAGMWRSTPMKMGCESATFIVSRDFKAMQHQPVLDVKKTGDIHTEQHIYADKAAAHFASSVNPFRQLI